MKEKLLFISGRLNRNCIYLCRVNKDAHMDCTLEDVNRLADERSRQLKVYIKEIHRNVPVMASSLIHTIRLAGFINPYDELYNLVNILYQILLEGWYYKVESFKLGQKLNQKLLKEHNEKDDIIDAEEM